MDKMNDGHRDNHGGLSRRAVRRRVLMGGLIVSPCGSDVLECTIHDRSEAGGKVRLPDERQIPMKCYFVDLRHQNVHTAELIWRRGKFIGLSLSEAHTLDDPPPSELEHVYQPSVRAKLRQIGILGRIGYTLDDCLSLVGASRVTYAQWRAVGSQARRSRQPLDGPGG
jgi:hypothetical protein